jgi:cytochrome d ubiquinol oxidase subunit I
VGGGFPVLVAVYAVLTVATVYVLRYMVRRRPVPVAPQEHDVIGYEVS